MLDSRGLWLALGWGAALAFTASVSAAENDAQGRGMSELRLSNFLSTGWDEPWSRWPRGDGTPDMSLLRVGTNFLVQLFRTDFSFQENPRTAAASSVTALTGTLEYALNRRLMLAVIGTGQWVDSRRGTDREGATEAAFLRLQLVENAHSSIATTVRVGIPNHDIEEKNTTTSLTLAGWYDLARIGLGRTGLYYHVQGETLAGPLSRGARRSDMNCALSIAKTWTKPDAFFGNATTFVEAYGKTDLDGDHTGRTAVAITPGVRATFAHRHILMAGVDFPLTSPRTFDRVFRFTWIVNF